MINIKKKLIILTILLLLLTSCSLPGLSGTGGSNDIVVASGSTTERQILAEIIIQMINHYDSSLNVGIINNLGSTNLIHRAMETGNASISSAMYTGTSITGELGMKPIIDPVEAKEVVVREFKKRFSSKWYPSYGFENTYAFMVTKEFAKENNITKVSDLENIAKNLRAGVDTTWIQRQGDGYEDFKRVYGFDFGDIFPMEIGLVYNAVRADEMDIVLGYTTDGRIQSNNLIILEDDKLLFPPYDASPVAKIKIIERYPILDKIILKLENTISNEKMQELNRRADEELIEPRNVAKKFLEENNYFEDKEPIILEAK